MTGQVKFFSDYNGYGFIVGEDGKEYYAHASKINMNGYKTLDQDDIVQFSNFSGNVAVDISVVKSAEPRREEPGFALKRNPFTPQDPISNANKFAGRREAVFNAIDNLYNGNNILILGPRGIGKSSLAYQLLYATSGETDLLKKIGIEEEDLFSNIISDHRCMQGNTLADIASGLLTTMCTKLDVKPTDSSTSALGVDLKLLSYTYTETYTQLTASDIASSFTSQVEAIFREYGSTYYGVTFLIDEIDTLDNSVDLASFLKAVTEKFRLDGYQNFYMIVSGVTGVITELIQKHPSASRLFASIPLDTMSHAELTELIHLHLDGTGTSITGEAVRRIISYSNHFPQPIQEISYYAYRYDTDNEINDDDVQHAVTFIVQKVKRQEYEQKFDRLGELGASRTILVLRRMAQSSYPTVSISYISKSEGISYSETAGALGDLIRRGIVEKPFRNQYKFTEPLFAIYTKMMFDLS